MPIFHVVAMAQNKVIGRDNKLPWHFSADLKFFKNLTTGNTVIMGRKTFDSIGRPLPKRKNFVISNTTRHEYENHGGLLTYFNSIHAAISAVTTENAFIIGGAEIYKQTIDGIAGIYLTLIHQDFEGDAFYPGVPAGFREVSREKLQESPLIEVIFYRR